MSRRATLMALLLSATLLPLRAQVADSAARLSLHIDGAHFFQDNEYEAELCPGYTLPGFFLRPYLRWQPEGRVSVEAGVHLLHYWGAHHYPSNATYVGLPSWSDTNRGLHLVPWMRARVRVAEGVHFLIGSLDRTGGHRLPLPLFDPEGLFASDPEAGIQLLAARPWIDADLWVDWREMIFRHSPRKEQFTVGANIEPRLRLGAGFSASAGVVLLAQHRGGNIVADSTPPVNLLNYGATLGLRYCPTDSLRFDLRASLLAYHQHHDPLPPFEGGRALFVAGSAQVKGLSAEASWWRGYQFIPLMGSYHFSNLSASVPDLHFDTRDMLTFRLGYRWDCFRLTTVALNAEWYHYLPYQGDRDHPDYPAKVVRGSANSFGLGVQLWFNPSITLMR